MKSTEMNPVLMIWEDYFLLRQLVPALPHSNQLSLAGELSRAILLRDDAFPLHAIRLYSKVCVVDEDSGAEHSFSIVLPSEADDAAGNVSVLAPMATAIIGFRKGERVSWPFPSGMKHLKILDVQNGDMQIPEPLHGWPALAGISHGTYRSTLNRTAGAVDGVAGIAWNQSRDISVTSDGGPN